MIRVWVVQFWVTVRYLREPWSALLLGWLMLLYGADAAVLQVHGKKT